MRFQELLETTDEDRALISLSAAVYPKLIQYADSLEDSIDLGKISDMFDTSIVALNNISINIQAGDTFKKRLHNIPPNDVLPADKKDKTAVAFWDEDEDTVVFNRDYLSNPYIKTSVTHELRHALDSVKSNKFPGDANRYFRPKNKEFRKLYYNADGELDDNDPRNQYPYLAEPAEINARFAEILHQLSVLVPKRYNTVKPNLIKPQLLHDFKNLLVKYQIAKFFPEKTASKDYQRLVKRALAFIQKEMAHYEATNR